MDLMQFDKFNETASKLKNGDKKAAEEIFDHFSSQMYHFFLVRTLNKETAEDLTQEVFFKVINKIYTFNEKLGSFSGWIWQIARNSAKDYFRKKKPLSISDELLQYKDRQDFLEGKNDPAPKRQVAEILDLVKTFSEEEQEIFSLHYLSDLSYRAISRRVGKSESSLRVLVHRLNKKIKKLLQ